MPKHGTRNPVYQPAVNAKFIVYTYFKINFDSKPITLMAYRINKQPTEYRKIMHNQPEYSSGFTLIELMVTISIAAILLAMAIPSFTSTIASNRLTTHANELVTALNFARSEAVKRGLQVTVRHIDATDSQWEGGWNVFVDVAGTPAGNVIGTFLDDTDAFLCEVNAIGTPTEDCLLKTYPALTNGFTLRTGGNYTVWVAYLPSGVSRSTAGLGNDTFTLCSNPGTSMPQRTIAISTTGRPRVSVVTGTCP